MADERSVENHWAARGSTQRSGDERSTGDSIGCIDNAAVWVDNLRELGALPAAGNGPGVGKSGIGLLDQRVDVGGVGAK
jgi:hypothetical protein